jgi:predicted phage gp36 major capsid-like protein
MANAIPLLEGTDASGGYLVRDQYAFGLQDAINRRAAAWGLSKQERTGGKRLKYTVYGGRPTASFVAEAAAKPVTGAQFSELTVDIKKIATTVIYTEEMLEDAQDDPQKYVNQDVVGAFSDLVDAHALGQQAGSAITTSFNSGLVSTTQTAEYDQTKQDGFALAVSAAIALLEGNGYTANGIAASFAIRAHMRDARSSFDTTMPIYGRGQDRFGEDVDALYGVPIKWTTNLATSLTAGAGKVLAVVGDFDQAIAVTRKDITIRTSQQATVDVSGTLHHLFQQNKTAMLWECRVGFAVHDLNRAFVAITNAS